MARRTNRRDTILARHERVEDPRLLGRKRSIMGLLGLGKKKRATIGLTPAGFAEPEGDTGGCEGIRVLIGRRGFCLSAADGSRSYASVAQVHEQFYEDIMKKCENPGEDISKKWPGAGARLQSLKPQKMFSHC